MLLRAAIVAPLISAMGCHSAASSVEEAIGPPSPACVFAGASPAPVPFSLQTSAGTVRCSIDAERAPRAAAMVVGLAMGRAPFRDPRSGKVVRRPYYKDMIF